MNRRTRLVFSSALIAALGGLVTPVRAIDIVVQAEDFGSTIDIGDPVNPGFLLGTDPLAAGGAMDNFITTGRNRTGDPPEVLATYSIDFPTIEPYHLYTRGKAEGGDGGNDSMWLPSDFGDPAPGFIRENQWGDVTDPFSVENYTWVNHTTNTGLGLFNGSIQNPAGPYTPAAVGLNDFVIGGREDGFRIDAFVFSTDDTLTQSQLDLMVGAPPRLGIDPPPPPAPFPAKILVHGEGEAPTAGADGQMVVRLISRFGAENVTYMQGDMAAADGSTADGFDLVVISSTLSSGTVRGKYEDTPVGVVNWEQALMRQNGGEFNMSEGGASGNDQTEITIVDPSSPLAAGLPAGPVTVFNAPSTTQVGTGALGPGVNLVAAAANGTDHAIFSADIGDALLGDGSPENPDIAPGRRVMFFIQDSSFNNLTPEGLALFDAAIDWAAIPEPSSLLLAALILCGVALQRGRK